MPPPAAEAAERPTELPISSEPAPTGGPSAESPEKLSLKARLKLFEKEIEQQGSAPAPKQGEKKWKRFLGHRTRHFRGFFQWIFFCTD